MINIRIAAKGRASVLYYRINFIHLFLCLIFIFLTQSGVCLTEENKKLSKANYWGFYRTRKTSKHLNFLSC